MTFTLHFFRQAIEGLAVFGVVWSTGAADYRHAMSVHKRVGRAL